MPRDVAGRVTEAMRTRVRGQGTCSLLPPPSYPSPLISKVFAFKRSSLKLCDPNQGQVVLRPGMVNRGLSPGGQMPTCVMGKEPAVQTRWTRVDMTRHKQCLQAGGYAWHLLAWALLFQRHVRQGLCAQSLASSLAALCLKSILPSLPFGHDSKEQRG